MVVPFTRFGRVAFGAALLVTMAGAAAAQDEWQAEWAKTVAAAKAEGQVVVNLSPSPARRDFLLKQWKEDYPEIELSLSIVSGSGFVPAVVTERMAGKYLWDVWHAGPNYEAIRAGLLDPLLPELIFPEVKDPDVWGGWDDAFYDDDKTFEIGLLNELETPYYNAGAIAPETVKARGLGLLLDPDYKGKIVWFDPRVPGPGATYLLLFDRVLGADGLRKLIVDQDPVFISNMNDAAQAIVRGKAVIAIAGRPQSNLAAYTEAGLKIDVRPFGNTPQTAWHGTDGAALGVFNKRPHPNAARLFVNWIMSKRIAALMSAAVQYDSRRRDVAPLDPDFALIPGADYIDAQRPEAEAREEKWMAEIKQLRPQ